MQRTRKSKDVKKIQAEARELVQHGVSNSVWASGDGREEVGSSPEKFTSGERRAKQETRLLRVAGPMELIQVASGTAKQCP